MPDKKYPVMFAPDAFEELTEWAGADLTEIDISIQKLLSMRPRQGIPFKNDLRAILMTPPGRRIVIVYNFDEESVFIEAILGSKA